MRRPNLALSDSAWEAMKGARRNLTHDAAVQEVAFLQRQYRAQWSHLMAASPVDLNAVLRTLIEKRIPFVLTGAHGISGWTGRPRSTEDVDILAKRGRNHARVVKAIQELYPQLEVRRFTGLTAFFVPGETHSVVDVACPYRRDQEETLADPVWTENRDLGLRYRVPSLEAALANKYGAMLTPTRQLGKRIIDLADFTFMVTHAADEGRRPLDLEKLERLGEKVWPGGGGKEVLRMVETVKAGKAVHLDALHGRL